MRALLLVLALLQAPATPVNLTFGAAVITGAPALTWTSAAGATGYRVSYGPESGFYTASAEVGNVTSWVIPSTLDPTLDTFFTVQSEAGATLSPFSNETELPSTAVNPNTPAITIADLATSMLAANANLSYLHGTPVTWTASATGPAGVTLQYAWWIFRGGAWHQQQGYSSSPSLTWTPSVSDVGGCGVLVWVRAVGSTHAYDAWSGDVVFTVQ